MPPAFYQPSSPLHYLFSSPLPPPSIPQGSEFVVIPKEQREATPLRLHHTPLAVTLGLLSPAPEVGPGGEGRGAAQAAAVEPRLLLDPGLKARSGIYKELCETETTHSSFYLLGSWAEHRKLHGRCQGGVRGALTLIL